MDNPLILASGLTVSRNEIAAPFPHVGDDVSLRSVAERVQSALSHCGGPGEWEIQTLASLPPVQRNYLSERGLMTPSFAANGGAWRLYGLFQGGRAAVEVNGADHIRLLTSGPGEVLSELWATIDSVDDQLETEIPYAFDERWGYLTAHLDDSGTGLRAYATIHVPGLMITGRLGGIALGLVRQGLGLAPLWNGAGGVFQVFNKRAQGTSEGRITDSVAAASADIVDQERTVRKRLFRENAVSVRDHIGRALGTAQQAWSVSNAEGLTLVSSIQVGVAMGLIEDSGFGTEDTLLLMRRIQPAHLVVDEVGPGFAGLEDPQVDEVRARTLRRLFAGARAEL